MWSRKQDKHRFIRRARLGLATALALVGAALFLPGAARAAETLDQAQTVTDQSWGGIETLAEGPVLEGQTFTAGISGRLTRLSLYAGIAPADEGPDPGPLTVRIYDTSGGFPTGSPLATTTISSAGVPSRWEPTWVDAVFFAPAIVSSGHQYAFVLESSSLDSYWAILLDGGNLYAGGEEIDTGPFDNGWNSFSGYDAAFETWVDPAPAPPNVGFLDPLTGSSSDATLANTAKNGRIVPVKVVLSEGGVPLTDANAPGPVMLTATNLGRCGTGSSTDPVDVYAAGSSASGGTTFRYDVTAHAWLYNLDTKAMGLRSGDCYRLDVSVNGTVAPNSWAILEPVR